MRLKCANKSQNRWRVWFNDLKKKRNVCDSLCLVFSHTHNAQAHRFYWQLTDWVDAPHVSFIPIFRFYICINYWELVISSFLMRYFTTFISQILTIKFEEKYAYSTKINLHNVIDCCLSHSTNDWNIRKNQYRFDAFYELRGHIRNVRVNCWFLSDFFFQSAIKCVFFNVKLAMIPLIGSSDAHFHCSTQNFCCAWKSSNSSVILHMVGFNIMVLFVWHLNKWDKQDALRKQHNKTTKEICCTYLYKKWLDRS